MNKFMNVSQTKIVPKISKTASGKHLSALRDAIALTVPFVVIGSTFLILANSPIPTYLSFPKAHPRIQQALLYPYNATLSIVVLIVTFEMRYKLGENYRVDNINSGLVSLAAYFSVILASVVKIANNPTTAINTNYFSSADLFVELIIATISTGVHHFIVKKNIATKVPDSVSPAITGSFNSTISGLFAVIVIWIIRSTVEITPYKNVQNLIRSIIAQPLTKLETSFWGTLAAFLIISLLWCIGLYGSITTSSTMLPIWFLLTSQSAAALTASHAVKNIVFTEFRYIALVDGSGATLGSVIAMIFFAKSQQYKKLGELSLVPSIFNINEPVLFGFPIVFSPIIWIPLLLMPIITVIVTYLSMQPGIAGKSIEVSPPGTTPMIIGGYIMTSGISDAILQIAISIISFLIYYLSFKIEDNLQYKKEMKGDTKK